MFKVPKIASLRYLLQYLKKDVTGDVDFLPADKRQSFQQVYAIIFDGHGQHVQISQNNKFAVSLQYLRKEVKISINVTDWFTYTHFKQVWSGMAAHAQCAYTDLQLLSCLVYNCYDVA